MYSCMYGFTPKIININIFLGQGFLELSEDLPQRLPIYLSTFDVVLVGDGRYMTLFIFPSYDNSFQYVKRMVEDILQIASPTVNKVSILSLTFNIRVNIHI